MASLCLAMVIQFMTETEAAKIVPSFNRIETCSK